MTLQQQSYPANLNIDYPAVRDRLTAVLRPIWSIPILILLGALTSAGHTSYITEAGKQITSNGGGIASGLAAATALMILFQQRYPRWWFNFALELNRFITRVAAYILLLTDRYPSTVDSQSVHLDVAYPNARKDLNRWLPLVKWLLAVPHYIVLGFLFLGIIGATIVGWFSILFTGKYPRGLFDYVVGVERWALRVNAYAFLLTTDKYPPFRLH